MTYQVGQTSSNQWWRWPLMPFAAFFGAALGSFLLGLLQWFSMKFQGGYSEDGWWFRYIMPVFTSAAFGWLYIWIACAIAPRGKVVAGTVMITILFIFLIFTLAFTWLSTRYEVGYEIQVTIGVIATLVAAVVALVQVHGEHKI
jgi:hypothetical protein